MSATHHDPPAPDAAAEEAAESALAPCEPNAPDPETPPEMGVFGEEVEARMVEYAPGQWAAVLGSEAIPRYGIVRFEHVAKNHWRPRLVGWSKYVALRKFFRPGASGSEPNPVLQRLGLDLSYNSILRLYKNGFVKGVMPVPHRILIDIESLNRHLIEASDPDFWTDDRVRAFKETIY